MDPDEDDTDVISDSEEINVDAEHQKDSIDFEHAIKEIKSQNERIRIENLLLKYFWEDVEKNEGAIDKYASDANNDIGTVNALQTTQTKPNESFVKSVTTRSKSIDFNPKLKLSIKCYLATKWLETLRLEQKDRRKKYDSEMDTWKSKLQEIEIEKSEIDAEMKNFRKNIIIGAKHPITNRVMAELVENYFNTSLRKKIIHTERYKIKAADCKAKRNKTLNDIHQKKEAIKNLHDIDVEKAKRKHAKSLKEYHNFEQEYFACRAKFNRLLQDRSDCKKTLDKEEAELSALRTQKTKKERSRIVFEEEKKIINKEKEECKALKMEIEHNPHCGHLPAVMDYVRLQAQLQSLTKSVRIWRSKVQAMELASGVSSKQGN